MTEAKTFVTQQGIPSVSWAWFYSGAIDLLVSTVLVGIGLYSLLHRVLIFKESIILVVLVGAIGFILTQVFNAKVQNKLFLRIPKANAKLDKMESFSEIAVIVILLGGLILSLTLDKLSLPIMSIASLIALLIGIINSIRVKCYHFLLIAFLYCVLLMRFFLGDNFTTMLPASQAWVRFLLIGLLFGTASIIKLVSFFKKYPVIEE